MTFKEDVINAAKKEDFSIIKLTDTRTEKGRSFKVWTRLEGKPYECGLQLAEHVKYTAAEFATLIESIVRGYVSRKRFNG